MTLLGNVRSNPKAGYEAGQEIRNWQDALTGLRRTVGFSLATDDPRLAYEDEAHFLFAHEDDPGFTYGFAVRKADGRIFEWKVTPPTAEPKEE